LVLTYAPTIVESKTPGRLLIFDPTDPLTPVGDLPRDEQDSYALVVAAANGDLIKLPVLTADSNHIESTIEGVLDGNGQLDAQVERRYFGQSGIAMSSIEKRSGSAELKKRLERSYSQRVPGTSLSNVASETRAGENALSIRLKLSVDRFGQLMQRRLLVVRPGLLTSRGEYAFTSRQRTAPVELEMDLRRDSIHIKIPQVLRRMNCLRRRRSKAPTELWKPGGRSRMTISSCRRLSRSVKRLYLQQSIRKFGSSSTPSPALTPPLSCS